MRTVLLITLVGASIASAGCARTHESLSLADAKPAPTAISAPNATPVPAPSPSPVRRDQALPLDRTWANYFAVSERSIKLRTMDRDGYDLSATYPKLNSSKPEARRFNKWIRHKVLGYVGEFRTKADAEQRNRKKAQAQLWGLELEYSVLYSNGRFISLRLEHQVMEAGQMHPINYYETINYDLQHGRQLRATDVFKRGYLKRFSNYSRKYLRDHYVVLEAELDDGTQPIVDNFTNWNIVPEGVLLSFEDYQVGPHSFGQPEFVVPYSALEGAIQQNVLRTLLVCK